jgi:hypothetical protein
VTPIHGAGFLSPTIDAQVKSTRFSTGAMPGWLRFTSLGEAVGYLER